MFLPKGNDVWVDLNISFIEMNKFLVFLKRQDFTGYIRLFLQDTQSVIFIQEGDLVNGVTEVGEERRCGQNEAKEVLNRTRREKAGTITLSRLSLETIVTFSEMFCYSVKRLYKDLSPEFSHLGKFVANLRDQAFTGYIEMRFSSDKKEGIIFFERGKIEAILTEEIEIGLKKQERNDLIHVNLKLLEEAQQHGVTYDVFSAY